jgi:hypothetical protein
MSKERSWREVRKYYSRDGNYTLLTQDLDNKYCCSSCGTYVDAVKR